MHDSYDSPSAEGAYESKLKSAELDDLFQAILSLSDVDECYRFFEDACTINELLSVAQRWQVAQKLYEGVTYQDISNACSASSATISRVNRCLSYGTGGYLLALKKKREATGKDQA